MEKMNWKEYIKEGDISEASVKTGISARTYVRAMKNQPRDWTNKQLRIVEAVKKIAEQRMKYSKADLISSENEK